MFNVTKDFVQPLPLVTRLEVIDHRSGPEGGLGRVFGARECAVTVSLQDDGRTLKVFVDDRRV
jgi:hypothetical protein